MLIKKLYTTAKLTGLNFRICLILSVKQSRCLYFLDILPFFSDCLFHLTKESGTFETPGFPDKYPNNTQCIWNIRVEPGRFILLSFHVFEIESHRGKCMDIVEVKDGSTSTDELLGEY